MIAPLCSSTVLLLVVFIVASFTFYERALFAPKAEPIIKHYKIEKKNKSKNKRNG